MSEIASADEPFAALLTHVADATFLGARQFRLAADLLIVAAMRGIVRTPAAQDAAAEAARDCGALAGDLTEAGEAPTLTWQEAIRADRARALSSIERLAAEWALCASLIAYGGREHQRNGSVPMRRKPSHHASSHA